MGHLFEIKRPHAYNIEKYILRVIRTEIPYPYFLYTGLSTWRYTYIGVLGIVLKLAVLGMLEPVYLEKRFLLESTKIGKAFCTWLYYKGSMQRM